MSAISKAEVGYIRDGLTADFPSRADGRGLTDFRPIFVETGVAELANGSGRAILGGSGGIGIGTAELGTEVIVAAQLEVEEIDQAGDPPASYDVTWCAFPVEIFKLANSNSQYDFSLSATWLRTAG